MRNLKFVLVFAAFGFFLSFVFGIFSHISFLSVILKALLFAVIFAVLGFGISFVSAKFLLEDSGSDFGGEINTQTVTKASGNSKGNIVDITIRDEELPQSISENHFNVGDNHQMLYDSDIGKVKKEIPVVDSAPDKNVSFSPVRNVENETNVSSKEAITPDSIKNNDDSGFRDIEVNNHAEKAFDSEKDLDTLPDMTGFSVDKINNSDSSEEEESEDITGFDSSPVQSVRSEVEVPEIKDASLYAKAISSILSEEKD